MKYLHVGLGKTGTTFLQNEVFPQITRILNLNYIEKKDFFQILLPTNNKLKKIIHSYNFINFDNHKFNEKEYFLSVENLCGKFFNPLFWKKSAKINKKIFGKDTTIIITLSEPLDFMSSIYCHSIQAYFFQKEKDFFLNHVNSLKFLKNKKKYNFLDLELFDFKYLIKLYLDNFDKVIIIKKEDIKNKDVLSKIFNEPIIKNIFFSNKIYNKSYSNVSIKLSFLIEKFLNLFKLSLSKTDTFARSLNKLLISNKFLKKFFNKLSIELRWRFFIQNRFDRMFSFKKYYVSEKKVLDHIQKDIIFYRKLKSGYITSDYLNKI